ncbi:MAG: hypothetical protein K9G67_04470 [Bacteroidales bacterium]|nr:hypothetical protein [Bacteroidales bacterium]MCF8344792.1 hypothetical protein [Bacteroidales bacterium]MCF8351774.1 hypothetical protein [Bacteroidales bacterium]MCF8375587.1 hypothetical protein [Bacteroidales bacterium]
MKNLLTFCVAALMLVGYQIFAGNVDDYYKVITEKGVDPKIFVREKLELYDLILFDDALHSAAEPFDFYRDYLETYPETVDYVFLEVVPINVQPEIDSFLNHEEMDIRILQKVFQADFGYGWMYQTYLDLFTTIWQINRELPEGEKIRIIGVDQPVYWEGLHNREDYNLFQKSLTGRDYFMYKIIMENLKGFKEGLKGLYLTNTRHAYKGIKNASGNFYWNTGTFFHQWHPGKTYSVRIHNVSLYIEMVYENKENTSTEGLDRMEYKWVRMDDGKWDEAFARNNNLPVAFDMEGNAFGQTAYIGNHMADAQTGQIMYDAYDGLIFLAPLEELHFSARTDFYFTKQFREELRHRVEIINGYRLPEFLQKQDCATVDEFIEKLSEPVPRSKNTLVK